ncbi:MAG TPA: amidohydrolase family protein [Chloroflexota bacterium]|nr:amidohydrolase family protein [Chloroflexota bacterium]
MDYQLISADDHIDLRYLPRDLWAARVPAAARDSMPHVEATPNGLMWLCGDQVWGPWGTARATDVPLKSALERGGVFEEGVLRPTTPELRLADLDRDGVYATVMYGPVAPLLLPDPAMRQLCYAAYNDWVVEFCRAEPRRLIGVGLLPADDPALARTELERVARLGLRHVVLLAAAADPPLYHPAWEPFWATAAETRIPIGMHLFVRRPVGHPEVHPITTAAIAGTQVQLQLVAPLVGIIFGGVLERHPGVRLVLAEAGIGWIPYVLERMDHEYDKYVEAREGWEARGGIPIPRPPSSYFRRQVWATFQDDRAGLGLLSAIGEDRVMWASDYPHPDSTWPHSRRVIEAQMGGLPEATRRKLTRDNASALYGLE